MAMPDRYGLSIELWEACALQYPNLIQCALMFDRASPPLDGVLRAFTADEASRSGARYNAIENKPGVFHRLFGGNELMITLEYLDRPADMAVFRAALGSPITKRMFPEVHETLARHCTHILINVSHGALPDIPAVRRMTEQLGMRREGASLAEFQVRLAACSRLALIAQHETAASAVHWGQSDQIYRPEIFKTIAGEAGPSLLHVHPVLFGDGDTSAREPKAGIRTYGAAHFIGREVLIEPSTLPWSANYETILAFLRVATTANGYIIPDGDTFGPEDNSLSYRVRHHDARGDEPPYYELQPLLHREYGYCSDDYVPRERSFDDQTLPPELIPGSAIYERLVAEWRAKRQMAEGIGGRFEVRSRAPAITPGVSSLFGRKN